MTKTEWEDITSYSRGERGQVEPSVWRLGEHRTGIVVYRFLGEPGWFLSCLALDIRRVQLGQSELEFAKIEALQRVSDELATLRTLYRELGVRNA